ncbi:DinB family protein [Persicobacter diffluens]|uniref:DinB-like domain-containing protein n=1 Tax=Persicobacter diffluens TaxID=981 RepID=A0AAN5AJU2_9BACT|nr:hypothetical protein PEDI_17640 [Persicobacter diffluens]
MAQTGSKQTPSFLEYVYQLNEGNSLSEAFSQSLTAIDRLEISQLEKIGLNTYEKEKWTVPTIFQHVIDWERIWCYRAIIFARKEGSIPEGHDQEMMGMHSHADHRSIVDLVDELRVVRQSSIMMFESFSDEILETNCEFFEYQMPLNAIGLTITAHQIHHLNIIKERYLPLIR